MAIHGARCRIGSPDIGFTRPHFTPAILSSPKSSLSKGLRSFAWRAKGMGKIVFYETQRANERVGLL